MEHFLNDDFSTSLQCFQAMLAEPDLDASQLASVHANIAAVQQVLELYRASLKSCETAISLDKRCLRAYVLQGQAYMEMGKPEKAFQTWKSALHTASNDPRCMILNDVNIMTELHTLVGLDKAVIGDSRTEGQCESQGHAAIAMPRLEDCSAPLQNIPQRDAASDMDSANQSENTRAAYGESATSNKAATAEDSEEKLAAKSDSDEVPTSNGRVVPCSHNSLDEETQQNNSNSHKNPGIDEVNDTAQHTMPTISLEERSPDPSIAPAKAEPLHDSSTPTPKREEQEEQEVEEVEAPGLCLSAKDELFVRAMYNELICTKTGAAGIPMEDYITEMRSNMPHSSGHKFVDDLTALGYILVNTGSEDEAYRLFEALIRVSNALPSVHIGMGSIDAMRHKLDAALSSFSAAIGIDASIADAWKRRGQTRGARGMVEEAISDLNKAVELQGGRGDADTHYQRGMLYSQKKNYRKAIFDFNCAEERGMKTAVLYNQKGMCLSQLGNIDAALDAHRDAEKIDPNFKESCLNACQMYHNAGRWKEALQRYAKVIAMSKGQSFFQVYSHLAFLLHGLGRPRKAANTAFYTVSIQILSIIVANKKKNTETETINSLFEKLRDAKSAEERDAIVRGDHASTKKLPAQSAPSAKESMEEQHNPALATSLCLTAVCCQSLGYYREAIQIFDKAMRADINHWCWFQREYALHQARYLDRDFSTFNMDVEFDPIYKEAWCKKVSMKTFLYFDVYASKRPPETSRILEKTKKAAVEYASVRKSYSAEMKELRALQNVVASSASTDPKVNDSPATAGTFMDACTALLTETAALQAWVHLDCVGFLPHCRMQSAFAIGAVQMAQQLRRHVRLVGMDADGPGLQVPNMSSSCPSTAPSQRPFYSEGDDGVLIGAMEAEGRERSKDVAACGGTGTATAATAPGRKNTKKKKKGQKSSSPTAEKSPSQEKGSSGVPESLSVASKETASSSSSSSSASARNGAHATGRRAAETNHTFCWRDFFDIGVRWRQAAEPNDPVWWIDGLPGNTFEEGFGLQTPIINGQLKTARYGRYFSKAFKLLKKHMKSHYILSTDERKKPSSEQVESLEAARSLAGLHAIVGENFYVIQPCYTATEQGTLSVLEGARITLVDHPPDGFDFSIRMPSTPKRWKQFESQICHIFQKVVHALNHLDDPQHNFLGSKSTAPTAPGGESESEDASPGAHGREQRVKALGLELFYYWCVFAPLTRGSALCGYMSLMAVALAAGCAYTGRLPNEKQLDWEAIFATNCDEFIETVSPWLHLQPLQQKGLAGSPSDVMQAIDVADTVRTLRHMNSLFNVAESLAESSADTCTNSSTSDLTG